MSISDKNRKVLWARSGNRCAICRHKLVVDETQEDAESVVGEECHICSRLPLGPRHDPALPLARVDDLDNLILLCGIHHKMIDDQTETYATPVLQQIKRNHESWVDTKLKDVKDVPPVRLRRFKQNIPEKLDMVKSGRELLVLAGGCNGSYFSHDDHLGDSEVELVGGFFQDIRDYSELWTIMEPVDQVRAARAVDDLLKELAESGFLAFAAVEIQRLEGGTGPPSNWQILHLSICRPTDPSVIWDHQKYAEPPAAAE